MNFAGGKKPVEHHAAVWVPDNEADRCMHCNRTQFSMLQRRVSALRAPKADELYAESRFQHHCRNCGAVVCGPCSSKKFLLAQQSTKPVRVCLECYDSLSQTKNEQVSSPPLAYCAIQRNFALCVHRTSRTSRFRNRTTTPRPKAPAKTIPTTKKTRSKLTTK